MHRSAKNSRFCREKSQGFMKISQRLMKIIQDFFQLGLGL